MPALTVIPLTAAVGAEVRGIDLSTPLDDASAGALRAALLEHLVLFFRDQLITAEQQLRFGQRFGPVMASVGTRASDEAPGVNVLDQVAPKRQGNDTWHSDHMFMPEPPLGTVLHALQLPQVGGDTCFASMYAAYAALSPSIQRFLDGLTAWNSAAPIVARVKDLGIYKNDVEKDMHPPVAHPVVRVHPETGRKALWVCGNFTTRIIELSETESDAVLSMLFEHIRSPEFQCRFHWEPNSLAFWDNRAVQHCAVADYHERRLMHRTMIAGDRPFGPTS